MNIYNKTLRVAFTDVVKERFRGCKPFHAKSVGRQEAVETLQHARIVLNDSYGAHAIAHPYEPEEKALGCTIMGDWRESNSATEGDLELIR